MSHTFHQLYYHFAWGTQRREHLVDRQGVIEVAAPSIAANLRHGRAGT